MIAWLLISFFVLLFLGVPIAMSLGLSAMGGILFLGGGSTVTIAQRMFEGMNSFALLAIPLYTFAGFTMSKGGISKRLMDFCYSIVGHIYGGLAHVNVLSSMIFAGISGSAVADTAGVSGMFMPEMIRKGYSKNFTVAVTAISSTIGIIIPPSIPMVVIAGICGISTGKLFLGGIIPGVLCGLAQMIVSYFMAKKEGVPKEPGHFTIGPVLHGLWESWPALLMPIIIVGTITMGIVSPTEAGVIAVVYGLFAGGIIYRELKWEDIKFAFAETVRTSGRIFIVIGAAKLYTVMLTTAGFDKWVAKTMLGFSLAHVGINCADGPFGPLTVIGGRIYMEDGRIFQTMDSRFPTCTNGKKMTEQIRAALGDGAELRDVTAAEPFYIEADSPAILACINTYNEVTGENAKPFTMGGGTYARHFPYAVSFGPEHVDLPLPEFGGPMHGANEAAPIDKLLEAVKIYIIALLRLEEIDF